ncbi:MAG: hypothetical protein ACREMB_03095 [Candidatus Rokuibacteriota bacterium]
MKVALTFGLVTALALVAPAAQALPEGSGDQFMKTPPKRTVYATEHHMGFSMRTAIIQWLGGVSIVDERDLRASERDRWWGKDVPLLPADVIQGDAR